MIFIKNTTWKEVYNEWKRSETHNDLWKEHFTQKDFGSWDSFREFYVEPSRAPYLDWKIYEIKPEEVLDFQCGAYKSWFKLSKDIGSRLFRDISKSKHFKTDEKVLALKKNFPTPTELIGFRKGDTITIFEGHHRCVSMSHLSQENQIPNAKIFLALADVSEEKLHPIVDYVPAEYLKRS